MNLNYENHIMSFHLNRILYNYLIQQYIPYHKSRFLYVGFYCMVCSQIAPWHGPSPKQIKHEQFDLYLILLDKLFLGDNEVSVKLGEDLHKKNSFFCISEGLLGTLKFLIWVKRDMKYDTWDNMCDFPMKELNVLFRHYVPRRCFTDSSDLRI